MPYALSCLTTVEKRAGVGKGVWGAIFLFFREALGISRCFCRGGEQIPFLHTLFNLFFIFRFKSCIFPSSVISTFPFVCGFFFFFFLRGMVFGHRYFLFLFSSFLPLLSFVSVPNCFSWHYSLKECFRSVDRVEYPIINDI